MSFKRNVIDLFFLFVSPFYYLTVGLKGNVYLKKNIKFFNFKIKAHRNCIIEIGENVTCYNTVIIGYAGSKITIKKNSILRNVFIHVGEHSSIFVDEGAILDYKSFTKGSIKIESGNLFIGSKANILATISMRFNSILKIGKSTGIGFNSEIVCDELVEIGEYCLISNHVSIYDTNSHSVDYLKRRARIEAGYPYGCSEIERPSTKPIFIGNDVWIGRNSSILKGAIIGDKSIIGMNATVPKGTYPKDSLVISEKPKILVIKSND